MILNNSMIPITDSCIRYCKEQLSNIPVTYQYEWTLALGVAVLMFLIHMFARSESVEFPEEIERYRQAIINLSFELGLILIILVLIWVMWFV